MVGGSLDPTSVAITRQFKGILWLGCGECVYGLGVAVVTVSGVNSWHVVKYYWSLRPPILWPEVFSPFQCLPFLPPRVLDLTAVGPPDQCSTFLTLQHTWELHLGGQAALPLCLPPSCLGVERVQDIWQSWGKPHTKPRIPWGLGMCISMPSIVVD